MFNDMFRVRQYRNDDSTVVRLVLDESYTIKCTKREDGTWVAASMRIALDAPAINPSWDTKIPADDLMIFTPLEEDAITRSLYAAIETLAAALGVGSEE